MTVVRPVLTTLPANSSTLEEHFQNSVPISYVVSPFAKAPEIQFEETTKLDDVIGFYLMKCTNCGAIHSSCSKYMNQIHERPRFDTYLCRICSKLYEVPISLSEQYDNTNNTNASSHKHRSRYDCVDYTLSITHPSPPIDLEEEIPFISWSIVLDGSCSDANYWSTMTSALSDFMEWNYNKKGLPPMYVSIWVLTADGGVSLWNHDGSYTAHYQKLSTLQEHDNEDQSIEFFRRWYHPSIQSSLWRTLNDPATWRHFLSLYNTKQQQTSNDNNSNGSGGGGIKLTEIIQSILDIHPLSYVDNESSHHQHCIWLFPSTTILQPEIPLPSSKKEFPQEKVHDSDEEEEPTTGYAAYYGNGTPSNNDDNDDNRQTDNDIDEDYISSSSSCSSNDTYDEGDPSYLLNFFEKLHLNLDYLEQVSKLGYECVESSTSIQMCFIKPVTHDDDNYLGLPYWESLCDDTGGELRTFSATSSTNVQLKTYVRSQRELMRYFNVKMRVLSSTCLKFIPLVQYWHKQQEVEWNQSVKILGHCRPYTTCCIDFETNGETLSTFGYGNIIMAPYMQLQVAYTVIEYDDNLSSWKPVRKLRVSTMKLPTTKHLHLPSIGATTEYLLNSIDMEALAVTLFHHFNNAGYNDGWSTIRPLAQNWLVSLLVAIYHSAEFFNEYQRKAPHYSAAKKIGGEFYSESRLLPSINTFDKDILLASGHEALRSLTLLVYGLLRSGAFMKDVESRWTQISYMKSMPPSALARCLAPRLELWKDNEVYFDNLPLSLSELRIKMEQFDDDDSEGTMILFLDSPEQILVLAHPISLLGHQKPGNEKKLSNEKANGMTVDELSSELRHAIDEAIQSYPMAPPVEYCLDKADSDRGMKILKRAMVKDHKLVRSGTTHMDGQQGYHTILLSHPLRQEHHCHSTKIQFHKFQLTTLQTFHAVLFYPQT